MIKIKGGAKRPKILVLYIWTSVLLHFNTLVRHKVWCYVSINVCCICIILYVYTILYIFFICIYSNPTCLSLGSKVDLHGWLARIYSTRGVLTFLGTGVSSIHATGCLNKIVFTHSTMCLKTAYFFKTVDMT